MAKSGPADLIPGWGNRHRRRIGLLGGSFNPAHPGHLHAALAGLVRLNLDEVWLLVSPQNPLKSPADMAPFADRLLAAQQLIRHHPDLTATGLEGRMGTRFTMDTVAALQRRFPLTQFVWLMGADNLAQLSRWNRWTRLFHTLPVAIVDRPSYSRSVLASKAARRFLRYRRPHRALLSRPLPAWTFLHIRHHPASASDIRALNRLQERPIEPQSADLPNLVDLITTSLDDDKGEEILVIDLRGRTSMADHMIIATGRSARQVGAMASHLVERLKGAGSRHVVEGMATCDWVLIDGGDVIVHLFRPEVRTFYNLEKMWLPDLPKLAQMIEG